MDGERHAPADANGVDASPVHVRREKVATTPGMHGGNNVTVDVSPESLQQALMKLERLLDLGESSRRASGSGPDPQLMPLTMTLNGVVETVAELGLCADEQIAGYRRRLEGLGVEPRRPAGGQATMLTGGGRMVSSGFAGSAPDTAFPSPRHQLEAVVVRLQPPHDESPVVVPLSTLLGRTDEVAVVLVEAHVHSSGVLFAVWTHGRGDHPPFLPTNAMLAERMGRPVATLPDLVVTLPDGRTSVTVDRLQPAGVGNHAADDVVLVGDGGSGTNDLLRRTYWLTPRPAGPVTLDFAWPEHGLGPTRHTVDLGAAAPAASIWP